MLLSKSKASQIAHRRLGRLDKKYRPLERGLRSNRSGHQFAQRPAVCEKLNLMAASRVLNPGRGYDDHLPDAVAILVACLPGVTFRADSSLPLFCDSRPLVLDPIE